MGKINIIAFSGSLRKESYTTKLLNAFQKSAPDIVSFTIVDISNLPFINQDLEDDLPQSVKDLHDTIKKADAVLFATPEYNRSYSPVIKNAIDWGTRPEGNNVWDSKPAGIIGCSPYSVAAFGAVNHLRQVMTHVNMEPMQQPEFYLSEIAKVLDENGYIADVKAQKYWMAFEKWIKKIKYANAES
jgi:chromate reductase